MTEPIYNTIGLGYNTTRSADPYITGRMLANLEPDPNGIYLDLGCGTGNYMQAFTKAGYRFYGADPSDIMLNTAKEKCPNAVIVKATAEKLPFEDNSFNGATAMFTMHHWNDQQRGLNELYRVLKPGSRAVFLSFTAEQMDGYWLAHYFPKMIKRSGEIIPTQQEMVSMCTTAGFSLVNTEKYFVHEGLEDHFLYSNKYNPTAYLDASLRQGISSFTAFSTPEEVSAGLAMLEHDIDTGSINDIMRKYQNDLGDYLFYIATK
ncbi:MAG: methyltransferase domain-containing protein [Bacteroidetes bacterium]|nr:methyltransferase domain-containing protein [Bacteroidota bacterium]